MNLLLKYKHCFSKCSHMRAFLCVTLLAIATAACPVIPFCVYADTPQCTTSTGSPNCLCQAGFEMVNGLCQACQLGFFNAGPGLTCSRLSTPTCTGNQYLARGTRFADSQCLDCMIPPGSNSYLIGSGTSECSWACEPGFNKNQL